MRTGRWSVRPAGTANAVAVGGAFGPTERRTV